MITEPVKISQSDIRRLLSAGVPEGCTAMQAIGYKEFAAALRGEEPLSDAVAAVKLRSRMQRCFTYT